MHRKRIAQSNRCRTARTPRRRPLETMRMRWTTEAVEDLKRLALEGMSASGIAAALGAASRNAVIGKASRIGIKLTGGGPGSGPGRTQARARRGQWAATPRHESGGGKPR